MGDPNKIVGHKTFIENGVFRHEPLTAGEAEKLMARIEAEEARRRAAIPDEETAIRVLFDAWLRLKEMGWKEPCYCPKDGRTFDVIEAGSTGIHQCSYIGEWPTGFYSEISTPFLFRERANTTTGGKDG